MNLFHSSLVINGKKFPFVKQLLKPRYNKEYFKRVNANIDQLKVLIDKRAKDASRSALKDFHPASFKESSKLLVKVKDEYLRTEKKSPDAEDKLRQLSYEVAELEERVLPTALAIPNRVSKLVPETEQVCDRIESDFAAKANLSKVLSHTKLSYINNCYSKSVVGRNSYYYFGIGAKLQYGLSSYFSSSLESKDFIPLSGMCLTKSAVVEAANSKDCKDYMTDPCRILTEEHKFITTHLVEASREAMLSFILTVDSRSRNEPMRLMMNGAGYGMGSDWFDSDTNRVTQFEKLHALVLNSSIETYSMQEYHSVRDIVWNTYKKLEVPARLVHCSIDTMIANEYDAHRIDVWLPSSQRWIPAGRISHYLDYVTVRSGMKRGHLIDSTVFDGRAVIASIIENRQTNTGKFIVPSVLKTHLVHLSGSEKRDYFRDTASAMPSKDGILLNYDQRRGIHKKWYTYGHSKGTRTHRKETESRIRWIVATGLGGFFFLTDWDLAWKRFPYDGVKRFLHDCFYRPVVKIWYDIKYTNPSTRPENLTYDEKHAIELARLEAFRKECYK